MGLLGLSCPSPQAPDARPRRKAPDVRQRRKAKVTRDSAGNPGGGGGRGPRRPPDRRRSHAVGEPAGEDPWASGLTGPQRAFPGWDGVPGYEFEGRRPPPPSPQGGGRPPGLRDEPRRFRYTPTVSQPPSVPPPAWPRHESARPGFEFDTPPRPAPPPPPARPRPQQPQQPPRPQRPPRPPQKEPGAGARAEWIGLLRSFLPEPVKRNWFAEFRSALQFRGVGIRVIIPIVSMMVFGVAVAVIVGANESNAGPALAPAPPAEALGFPPATLAGSQFTVADTGRGISQTLGRITSDGAEIVAVGSQQGALISRAQFFVSTDDGRSWSMGHVQTPDGGPPPPGYAARFVAGGNGAWVALGPRAIWTSPNGLTWTLSSTAGLPLRPGDQISVLKRTAAGFIAAGSNVPAGHQAGATPVVFLSANGTAWQRLGAAQLKLATGASTNRVLDIRYAAAFGTRILIAGDVLTTQVTGKPPHKMTVTIQTSAAWLSANGGTTWTPAGTGIPAGHGAQAGISGVAVTADGFILLRPATAGRQAAVDVYRSAAGTTWTYQATLSTPAGFTAGMVNGAAAGAVVTGQAGHALIAFTSADGATWRRTPAFGTAAAQDVSGVAMAQGGTAVTAGTTINDPDSRQPLLTVLGAQGAPVSVKISAIPGADDPELAVNDLAAGNGKQVAVGSANGYPAAWLTGDGGTTWTRASGQTQAVLDRPGVQQLTSVTFGADGWLAVGGVIAVAAQHPVVLGSGNGSVWTAADGEAAFGQPGLVTEQAAAGPASGYVIVGYQSTGNRTQAAAWWSAGLTGWQRASGLAAGKTEKMLAVTAGPDGFVAVGATGTAAAAWTSADGGRTWTEQNVPLPVGTTRAVLQHVASNGRTVAAIGTVLTTAGQQLPFAASSADGGRTWTESALPVPAGRAFVTALTGTGTGFVATGTFGLTPGHQDVVVWTSASGSAWKAVTPGGSGLTGRGIQAITGLAVAGRTMDGIGFTALPSGEQPVLWQSPVR
jgi:hypothetical protein